MIDAGPAARFPRQASNFDQYELWNAMARRTDGFKCAMALGRCLRDGERWFCCFSKWWRPGSVSRLAFHVADRSDGVCFHPSGRGTGHRPDDVRGSEEIIAGAGHLGCGDDGKVRSVDIDRGQTAETADSSQESCSVLRNNRPPLSAFSEVSVHSKEQLKGLESSTLP